jgi:hypothetical protein
VSSSVWVCGTTLLVISGVWGTGRLPALPIVPAGVGGSSGRSRVRPDERSDPRVPCRIRSTSPPPWWAEGRVERQATAGGV